MKYAKSAARRRGLFMAGSSLSALLFSATVPAVVVLAPTQVLAADECGVQAADGEVINCAAGTYPTGITYTGGTVPVSLDDTIVVSDGGITLTGTTAVSLDSTIAEGAADAGDLQITNTAGAGVLLTGGSVTVDLTDDDGGDTAGFITGSAGLLASSDGDVNLNTGNLAVTATGATPFLFSGIGLGAQTTGAGNITMNATGPITGSFIGVGALAVDGQITISVGDVSGDFEAIHAVALGEGGVNITAGALTGSLWAAGASDVSVSTGNVTGDVGGLNFGAGALNLNTGAVTGNVLGTAGAGGVNINTGDVGGFVMANASGGGWANVNFSSAGAGVTANATGGGSANVNGGSITGDVVATADTGGSASIGVGAVTGDVTATATGGGSASASTGDVTGSVVATADSMGGVNISTGAVGDGVVGTATGGGAVSVSAGGAVVNGIMATADTGGAVSVNATGDVTGGVNATSSGGGAVTVAVANVTGTGTPVVASSDTGYVSVTINGVITGDTGFLADIDTTGSVTLGIGSGVTASQSSFDVTYGNMLTINNGGTWTGAIDFTGATAGHFNNSSTWDADAITFTEGDDSFSNSGTASFPGTLTYDFLGGNDSFSNSGTMDVGTALTLENLENFDNSGTLTIGTSLTVDDVTTFGNGGTIALGTDAGASTLTLGSATAFTNTGTIVFGAVMDGSTWVSDGETNDRVVADGAAFTGGGTLVMDVDFNAGHQADCSEAVAADCLSLVGGSTPAGVTTIRLNSLSAGAGGLNRIVLVDLAGGTTTAGAFTLAADQPLDQGLFFYRLGYDTAEQQFILTGLPGRGVFEFGQIGTSAQNVWYSSTGSYFERQADLRTQLDVANGPGTWIKVNRTNTDREVRRDFAFGAETFDYNLDHEQDTIGIIGGVDLIRGGGAGSAHVFGVTVGKLDSELDFKVSSGTTNLEGMSYGVYATVLNPSYFIDGIVQVNKLDVEQDGDWNPGGFAEGEVKSTGAQVEAGWRFPVNEGESYIEPLASLAYVTTEIDGLALPDAGGAIEFEDATSLRGSLGVRISGDADLGPVIVKLSGVGRMWNEFEGENTANLLSAGNQLSGTDDFNGSFSEVGVGLSFYSASKRVSGFFNTGVKFKDEYMSSDTSIGVRLQW